MSLRNDGGRDARNWRVRFLSLDADTVLYLLDSQRDGRHVTGTFVGSGWQHQVLAANRVTPYHPGVPVSIHGTHTLNFAASPTPSRCSVGLEPRAFLLMKTHCNWSFTGRT